MPEVSKEAVADILEHIGQLLELKGENVFKVRAYQNAARAIQTFSGNLPQLVAEERLHEIAGIGKAIAEKISELVTTGQLAYYDALKAEFPPQIFELFQLQGVGPKKIKALWETLNITSIASLEAGLKDGRVAALPGFGKKTAENLLLAIEARTRHAGRYRMGDIAVDAEALLGDLRDHPAIARVSVCGSYRRRKEVVGDLDFLASTKEPEAVSDFFVTHPMVESVLAKGATKSSVRLKSG